MSVSVIRYHFIVDTNFLLTNPTFGQEPLDSRPYIVVITRPVLEELDGLKKSDDVSLANKARQSMNFLESVQTGLTSLPGEGVLYVWNTDVYADKNDDRILLLAQQWARKCNEGEQVILLTNDKNLRIKARSSPEILTFGIPDWYRYARRIRSREQRVFEYLAKFKNNRTLQETRRRLKRTQEQLWSLLQKLDSNWGLVLNTAERYQFQLTLAEEEIEAHKRLRCLEEEVEQTQGLLQSLNVMRRSQEKTIGSLQKQVQELEQQKDLLSHEIEEKVERLNYLNARVKETQNVLEKLRCERELQKNLRRVSLRMTVLAFLSSIGAWGCYLVATSIGAAISSVIMGLLLLTSFGLASTGATISFFAFFLPISRSDKIPFVAAFIISVTYLLLFTLVLVLVLAFGAFLYWTLDKKSGRQVRRD